jgi:hypothetical protein
MQRRFSRKALNTRKQFFACFAAWRETSMYVKNIYVLFGLLAISPVQMLAVRFVSLLEFWLCFEFQVRLKKTQKPLD